MCQIWTDASFDSNTKEAGLGILIRHLIPNGVKETRIHLKTKAEDSNQAELLAIYYALHCIKDIPSKEAVFLVTDSKVAIDCIREPENKNDKFRPIAKRINDMLKNRSWKIYHKKAHTNQQDRYSVRQAITDRLAKQGRK